MAKKKGKQNPENYFNNISDWQTEAEPLHRRAYRFFVHMTSWRLLENAYRTPGTRTPIHQSRSHCWLPLLRGKGGASR